MKKKLLTIVMFSTLSFTACKKENTTVETTEATEVSTDKIEGSKYKVETTKSVINWEGKKITGGKHTGTIHLKEGYIIVDEGKVVGGNFVIDMNTITDTDLTDKDLKAKLEGHLKGTEAVNSDDFFNVPEFPEALFEITSITDQDGSQMVEGNLTIKGKTNAIKFPATLTVSENGATLVTENFEIDRTKWGVNFSSGSIFSGLGNQVINDNIVINLNIMATK